jgi:dihydropteroate synthase
MADEGADILDLGGESTRPGHAPVSAETEWARLAPVFTGLRESGRPLPPISIDTYRAETAERALAAGASIVNDVWGFRREPRLADVVASSGAAAILMHNRDAIDSGIDIVDDILRTLERSLAIARGAGIAEDRIVLDPGIGFGKTFGQSFAALAALPRLKAIGFPVLLGLSRKGFVGSLFDPALRPLERLPGTLAGNVFGALSGADIIRVHDVAPHVQAVRMVAAIAAAA